MSDDIHTDDADDGADESPPAWSDEEPNSGSDAGRVLKPGELDITDDEAVEELEEGRFVVSASGGPPNVPDSATSDTTGPAVDSSPGTPTGGAPRSPEAARNLLSRELERTQGRYAVDVVGQFDGEPARHRTVSNDVVATFENLLVWYARYVTQETPVEEVLDILLREASVVPEPDTPNLAELLEANDLTPEDSIAELVDAIADEQARD